jgi:SWI/SNF related-matrix-associated actin-dependent regulator of chromatin subfamily C
MDSERLHGREGGFHGEVANSIQQKGGHKLLSVF